MKNDSLPLVSVIIPAYNAANLLHHSVNSALNQDYENLEVIIIDDGSNDNTSEIAQSFAFEYPGKVIFIKQNNGKQGKARNTGISHSKGQFIAFLDADDEWEEGKISNQVDKLITENLDLVYSDGYLIATESNQSLFNLIQDGHEKIPLGAYVGPLEGENGIKLLYRKNRIPTSSVLCRKDKVCAAGGFNENLELQNCEDYLLWLSMIQSGTRMKGFTDKFLLYRMHPNSSTNGILNGLLPLVKCLLSLEAQFTTPLRIQLAGHIRTLTIELIDKKLLTREISIYKKYNESCSELVWRIALKLTLITSFKILYLKVLWRYTRKWTSLEYNQTNF